LKSNDLKRSLVIVFLLITYAGYAQLSQTVKGRVVDKETQQPLVGVNVVTQKLDSSILGVISDINGYYELKEVPIGRRDIKFTFIGFKPVSFSNLIITSGKQLNLNVEMELDIATISQVVIKAKRSGEVLNEMAVVSAREFSVEETEKYAGSRGDPARMVSNYAGVQSADDSRNDVVIRGNSPIGVLYRLEGINIPNPNHFAIPGTGGGPVSVLNNKFLSNSDFFTGAFPAEFGNSIAGVFDLKMRNGNADKFEGTAQLGFLGTEWTLEAPISKEKKSSFMGMYRYSTLQLFDFMGINIGSDAIPKYQDGAFRLNFPGKNGSSIAVFGVGGLSDIDIVLSDADAPNDETFLYGDNDRDQYFGSKMGVLGIAATKPINESAYLKTVLSASHQEVNSKHDRIYRRTVNDKFVVDSLPAILAYEFSESKISLSNIINKRFNPKTTLKAGLIADLYLVNYIDSVRPTLVDTQGNVLLTNWQVRWNANDNALMLQPFIQLKRRLSEKTTITAGLSALYYSINNNSLSPVEPRLGLQHNFKNNSSFSLGAGLHSQANPNYTYYYGGLNNTNSKPLAHNKENLGLFKSAHFVASYQKFFPKKNVKVGGEIYYQYLFNVPVDKASSSFSIINSGSGFSRLFPDSLQNTGEGRNVGVELTIEKYFSKNYYFLITASAFDAKYKGSDKVERNTSFNGQLTANVLGAKEFNINQNSTVGLGVKATYNGGRWYGPVNTAESTKQLEVIYEDASVNTLQFDPYFRVDGKIYYRWNRPKVSHEFAIDLVNVTNKQNILSLTYAPDHPSGNPLQEEYQLGFLPLFYYKIDF